MNIALDYDGTYTADPKLWDAFLRAGGWDHDIYIVTARFPDNKVNLSTDAQLCIADIIYTSGRAKRQVVDNLGLRIDIWVDDRPERILQDSPNLHI